MSFIENFKGIGGHIFGVLKRLTSYKDTEVVDSTTSLNEALLEAVKSGEINRQDALEIAHEYVESEKRGKKFERSQATGLADDRRPTMDVEAKGGETSPKSKKGVSKDLDEREM